MSSEPDKPDAVEVSEGEKIQTALAKDQINYYRSTYAPLEGQFADEAGRDYSSRLSAQAGSAGMREATPGLQRMALSSAPVDTAAIGGAVASARNDATAKAVRTRDDGRLSALGVGLGVTADAGTSLSTAARSQTSAAIDTVRTQMTKQEAELSNQAAYAGAAGTLAGAGLTYYGMSKGGATPVTTTPQQSPAGNTQQSPASLNNTQRFLASRVQPMFR
ncbi:hypothetical protein NL64_06185 [Pseudomonas fluorescens]|uniref:hypothetical protein n=1 Tax=Pseudomonas fluorescens TaxID=294 RepID=UPI00054B942E|nr:hypothetical protein [Pseudomonas fluorescens]KII34849.1 hypothetical protein NL64_06185 [Pseudomonas fluorescens]